MYVIEMASKTEFIKFRFNVYIFVKKSWPHMRQIICRLLARHWDSKKCGIEASLGIEVDDMILYVRKVAHATWIRAHFTLTDAGLAIPHVLTLPYRISWMYRMR